MIEKLPVDPQTRQVILALYFQKHMAQAEIAATVKLPLDLVADVLDGKR